MSDIPPKVPAIPVRAGFYFPGAKVPLSAGRKRSVAALVEAVQGHGHLLLVHQREVDAPEPPPETFPTIGTVVRVREWVKDYRMLRAEIQPVPSRGDDHSAVERLRAAMIRAIELDPKIDNRASERLLKINDINLLTDIAAQNSTLSRPERQRLLETVDASARAAALIPAFEAHAAKLSGAPPPIPDPPRPAPQDDIGEAPTDPLQRVRYAATLLACCGGLPPVGVVEVAMEEVESEDENTQKVARRLARQAADDRRAVEDHWPLDTDFDRLDAAFVALNHAGVAARHDWGLNHDDGLKLFDQEFKRRKHSDRYVAILFYHQGQTQQAALGRGLRLNFEALQGDAITIGHQILKALHDQGLPAYWPEDPFAPIDVPIRWQRRMPPDPM